MPSSRRPASSSCAPWRRCCSTSRGAFPQDLAWILRVDGHADRSPLRAGARYASNWELSAARAIAVGQFLIGEGLPPNRVAATAFGEYQPIDPGDSPEAFARNRRIELRLTDR
ncbi:OmpA family protein [Pseudoroseomonas cervicalis]|uniref:OmpA family protein n=1 Tax=Teichococcus cervicalis TaxID=204525 RepID=UPI0027D7D28C|nr:OmpA family protein [Pseudoroseomonas cervicalis]